MSKNNKDPWVRYINVTDPTRHRKGYTLYKVTSKVFPKNSVEAVSEVTVLKRYSEFKKLHKALFALHQGLYLKGTFPPFAKAQVFGRFDDAVIEERRISALNLLQFAANHAPLFTSQVFVKFFETECVQDESVSVIQPEETIPDTILQPVKSDKAFSLLHSSHSNSGDDSSQAEPNEPHTTLGGIWQHHQVSDNISLSSHRTEEDDDDDDRTTFTDEESNVSRLSLNLTEFDPLAACNAVDKSLPDQDEICNSWLLSALQFCNTTNSEKYSESSLEFPKPFIDLESVDDTLNASNQFHPIDTLTPGFQLPLDSSINSALTVCEEFDPLSPSEKKPEERPDAIPKCDNLSTPTACQPSYVLYAAKSICAAQEAESNEDFAEAFDLYKKAIDILLQGSQKETCVETRDAVRKKLLFFLMKAEEIYENKLPKCKNNCKDEGQTSLFAYPMQNKILTFKGCVQDLKKYKVLGVIAKVLLVLDVNNNSTYIIKTLYKSSNPQNNNNPNIVPQNVPYLVQLVQVYETSYALFLVLEHASGGRLWDYVSSYLHRSPLSSCPDRTSLYEEPSNTLGQLFNVYSGKKISDTVLGGGTKNSTSPSPEGVKLVCNLEIDGVDSDLIASKNCPPSYIALFKQYASAKKDSIALAKYHVSLNGPKEVQETKSDLLSVTEKATVHHGVPSTTCKKRIKDERNHVTHHPQLTRHRLSSTGSLETALSQKAGIFEAFHAMDDAVFQASCNPIHLPETCITMWAAEMVVALESLHKLGIIWMDFHPNNILLGAEGHILLTYQCKWNCVDHIVNEGAKENFYCAPEVGNIFPVANECDWWSFGVILFELLTGRSLGSFYPTGITRHTVLNFPSEISPQAKDLLSKLLQYNSSERLGSGVYGVEEIKSHPFFCTVDWESLCQA